jgi:hypothetical protein
MKINLTDKAVKVFLPIAILLGSLLVAFLFIALGE